MPYKPAPYRFFAVLPAHWGSRDKSKHHPAFTRPYLEALARRGGWCGVVAICDGSTAMLLPNGELAAVPPFKRMRHSYLWIDRGLARRLCPRLMEAIELREEAKGEKREEAEREEAGEEKPEDPEIEVVDD